MAPVAVSGLASMKAAIMSQTSSLPKLAVSDAEVIVPVRNSANTASKATTASSKRESVQPAIASKKVMSAIFALVGSAVPNAIHTRGEHGH